MSSGVKKVWNFVTTILLVVLIILAVLLVGVRIVGFDVYTVLSGSMEPTYHTGSVIYVKDVNYAELEEGDVITFMLDEETLATHRIVEVVPDDEDPTVLRYRTKGDANDVVDGSLVHYKNVVGMPVFTIPYLGYFASWIQNPPGQYLALALAAIIVMLFFLPDLLFDDTDKKDKAEEQRKKDAAV